MRLAEWEQRLRGEDVGAPALAPEVRTALRALRLDIHDAAALAEARAEHRRDAAYVMYLDEAAAPNALAAGRVRQVRTIGVAVVLAIANHRDPRGGRVMSRIETARETVSGALLGWEPPSAGGPVTYRRGRLMHVASGTVWWQDEYEVSDLVGQVG